MLVKEYGSLWARNKENIRFFKEHLPSGSTGVYVLFNGSTPVYVGKGHIRGRITSHNKSAKREFWDHFSWFLIKKSDTEHELEALLITTLPFYLRIFTRQDARFLAHKRCKEKNSYTQL